MCFSFNTRYVWQYSRHATQKILRNWTNFGAVPEQRGKKKMQVLFTDMLLEKKEKILIKVNSSLCYIGVFFAGPLLFSWGETTCTGTAGYVKMSYFFPALC